MIQSQWSETEAACFLSGMRSVATLRGRKPLDAIASEMLEAVGHHVLQANVELESLPDSTPAELAAQIENPRKRLEFVQFLILMPYLDMQVDPEQVRVVDDFARELGVESNTLQDLHRVRDDRLKRLALDFGRRSFEELGGAEGARQKLRTLALTLHQFVGDKKVAQRYRELEDFPEGSLGHTLFHFYRERKFPLPGEPKSFSEMLIGHDCSHILGGFNTDMKGEIDVAGFEAGLYDNAFGFELLLEVILDFHMGKTFTTVGLLEPGSGNFDPESVVAGYERGVACKVNPLKDWDFWTVADQQVGDLRARYGLPELEGPLLPPAPESG